MPKYFFHIEHSKSVRDTGGIVLDDMDAAKCHAVTVIAESLCRDPKGFWEADNYQVVVSDEAGLTLFSLAMMSILAPAIGPRPSR